jgi:nucleotide-binding universal stress UspA family protein
MIRKILIPTDFSAVSRSAISFGIELCRKAKVSEILLFHAYHIPVTDPFTGDMMNPELTEALHQRAKQLLNELRSELEVSNPDLTFRGIVQMGFAANEIVEVAKAEAVDLIVMGTKGENDLADVIFGSVTVNVMEEAPCPLFVVPPDSHFSAIEKLTFACDIFHLDVYSLAQAINIARSLQFPIHFFTILTPKSRFSLQDLKKIYEALQYMLRLENFTYEIHEDKEVVKGIESYVSQKNIHCLVMTKHYRSFWELLFKRSVTEQIAAHTRVPLLILHSYTH